MTPAPDAAAMLWRACCRIEPDRRSRSAALFIAAYIAVVVAVGAGLSHLAGIAVGT